MERGYYWNNNKQLSCETERNREGQLHGTARLWYYDGQLCRRASYHEGQRHGVTEMWYSNGNLRFKKYFLYGKEVTEAEYKYNRSKRERIRTMLSWIFPFLL